MPTMSKIYGVKSNAARAAAAYKLTRTDLVAVSGGWCFPIPELNQEMAADLAADAPFAGLNEVPAGWDSVEGGAKTVEQWEADAQDLTNEQCAEISRVEEMLADPNEPDVPDARAAHTVVNGRPTSDPLPPGPWGDDIEADKPCADISSYASERVFNGTRKPKHLPKTAKPPKRVKIKAPRPVVDGATKRGTKAYADKMAARRRAGMNKRGITELVIKEIRTRWTPTSALLKMTGWQPTTLRGVLSLYAKKEGIEIKGETRDGERYYLVAR